MNVQSRKHRRNLTCFNLFRILIKILTKLVDFYQEGSGRKEDIPSKKERCHETATDCKTNEKRENERPRHFTPEILL